MIYIITKIATSIVKSDRTPLGFTLIAEGGNMLRKTEELKRYELGATDGTIGRTKDFYFDDEHWTIRYILADTGKWIPERQVLISPFAVRRIDDNRRLLQLTLNKKEIEESPPADCDKPVSRQFEERYYTYYGWPMYWFGPFAWGPIQDPQYMGPRPWTPGAGDLPRGDTNLRSVREVCKYRIEANDGEIGHVEDFVFSDENWMIRYIVVDTRNWLPGKKVLLPAESISNVNWFDSRVLVHMDRETIRSAPEFDSTRPMTREEETRLFSHYEREPYWMHAGQYAGAR